MDDQSSEIVTASADAAADDSNAGSSSASSSTLSDDHHDWASNFCGIDTRAGTETSSGAGSDSASASGPAASGSGDSDSGGIWGAIKGAASSVVNKVEDVASDVGHTVSDAATGAINTVGNVASDVGHMVSDAAGGVLNTVETAASGIGHTVADAGSGLRDTATKVAGDIGSGNLGGALGDAASGVASTAGHAVSDTAHAIVDTGSAALDAAGKVVTDTQQTVADAATGIISTAGHVVGDVAHTVSDAAGPNSIVGEAAGAVGNFANTAAGAAVGAVNTVTDFNKGVVEGAVSGVEGLAKGVVNLADSAGKEAYALATDANARAQALDTVEHGAEAVGRFAETAVTDPGKAAGEVGDAIESGATTVAHMAGGIYDQYQQAAAAGHGAEFLGKGVGQAAVLVAGAVLTDGASVAAEGGAVAAESAAVLGEGAALAGEGAAALGEGAAVAGEGAAAAGEGVAALGEGTAAAGEEAAAAGEEEAAAGLDHTTERPDLGEADAISPESSANLAEGPDATAATDYGQDLDLAAEGEDGSLLEDGKDAKDAGKPAFKTPAETEKDILDKYGNDMLADKKKVSGGDATNLQDDATFKDEIKKRHPGIEKSYNLDSINGESYQGKIFVNKDRANPGTAFHEQMHHYSSDAFKSDFGVYNGVKINEGVTEYFTRQIYSGPRRGIYDTEAAVAEALAKKIGDATLRKAYFQGDAKAIEAVKSALSK